MSDLTTSPILRRALLLDAVATGATALLLVLGAGLLADLLGLPSALMRVAGLILVPFVGLVAWTASQARPPAGAVWTIILGNAAWVAASLVLLVSGWVAPTALGYAFVIAQALAVGIFAELQVMGLRRAKVAVA